MAKLPGAFKTEEHDDMNTFDAWPPGPYNVKIVESSMELTKKAKEANDKSLGQFAKLKMEVLDGPKKGSFYFVQLNLINTNPTAVELAQKELATLCRAIGKVGIGDTVELHGIPFVVELGLKGKESDQYGIQNKVKTYSKYKGSAAADPASAPAGEASAPKKKW